MLIHLNKMSPHAYLPPCFDLRSSSISSTFLVLQLACCTLSASVKYGIRHHRESGVAWSHLESNTRAEFLFSHHEEYTSLQHLYHSLAIFSPCPGSMYPKPPTDAFPSHFDSTCSFRLSREENRALRRRFCITYSFFFLELIIFRERAGFCLVPRSHSQGGGVWGRDYACLRSTPDQGRLVTILNSCVLTLTYAPATKVNPLSQQKTYLAYGAR